MSETSEQILAKVTAQGEKIATQGTVIDLIKGDLDYVKGQLANATGGLSAEEVATLNARLAQNDEAIDANTTKLQALDAETDPNAPTP